MANIIPLFQPILRSPLFCLALFWAACILLSTAYPPAWIYWGIATALLLLASLFTISADEPIGRIALCLATLSMSATMTCWHLSPTTPSDPRYLPSGGLVCRGYLLDQAVETEYGWHSTFRLTAFRTGDLWHACNADVYLFGTGAIPRYGRYVQLLGKALTEREPGNPYGFSWNAYLKEQELYCRIRAYRVTELNNPAPASRLHQWRASIHEQLIVTMPGAYASTYAQLLNGFILGVHGSPLPKTLTEQFRKAGIIHLMVVSGSQVTLLASVLLYPMIWLGRRSRTSFPRLRVILSLLSLPILALYIAIADRGPSVDRALWMALLMVASILLACSPLARSRSFRPDGLTLLAAAGLIVLITRPASLFNPSMQLSFAAVFGLLTIAPVLMRLARRVPSALSLVPAATLAAQFMTFPVLAWHFGVISPLGIVTNLAAVPLAGILLPLGMCSVLFALIAPSIAHLLNYLIYPLVSCMIVISGFAARFTWAEWPWVIHSPWIIVLYYLILAAVTYGLSRCADRINTDWSIPAGREPRMW